MIEAAFLAAGALVRLIDGANTGVPNGARVALFYALAIGGAAYAGAGLWALWVGGWAATSIVWGQTRWEDPGYQALRFGVPAMIGAAPFWTGGLLYVGLGVAAAVSYLPLVWLDRRIGLPRWWIFDGPEAYYRLPMGAAIIGGCALL